MKSSLIPLQSVCILSIGRTLNDRPNDITLCAKGASPPEADELQDHASGGQNILTVSKHRRSIRLKEYDYSQPGTYFVTACVKDRMLLFGRIENGCMTENEYGGIVRACWDDLPNHYTNIRLDSFVVMPNHIHGIIVIVNVGAIHESPLPNESPTPATAMHRRRMLLPKIVGRFKTNSGKRINEIRKAPGGHLWQRNYFEHIIRTEQSLGRIRNYIFDNPRRWDQDTENPESHL